MILQKAIKDVDDWDDWSLIEELSNQRADLLISHALKGYGMTLERAKEILINRDLLDSQQQEVQSIIKAAVDNMSEFAAAEEYHAIKSMMDLLPYGFGEIEELDEEELEELLAIFEKYNSKYAHTENLDVEYAMSVAAQWVLVNASSVLMYMTQGDERVRPWHLQHEGFTAPKVMFPGWLIPPIEHQCRCFLVEVGATAKADKLKDVRADIIKDPVMPEWFNRTFKESVCQGGRIFSDEHPYFEIDLEDMPRLSEIVESIKARYYGRDNS